MSRITFYSFNWMKLFIELVCISHLEGRFSRSCSVLYINANQITLNINSSSQTIVSTTRMVILVSNVRYHLYGPYGTRQYDMRCAC